MKISYHSKSYDSCYRVGWWLGRKFCQWLGDRLSRNDLGLHLKAYFQAPLFYFIFVLLQCRANRFVPFLFLCCMLSPILLNMKQEDLKGLFGQMVVLTRSCNSYAGSVQNYICTICTVLYIPFGNDFKCRSKQDLKICHFSPSVVVLSASLQGVNEWDVSQT